MHTFFIVLIVILVITGIVIYVRVEEGEREPYMWFIAFMAFTFASHTLVDYINDQEIARLTELHAKELADMREKILAGSEK